MKVIDWVIWQEKEMHRMHNGQVNRLFYKEINMGFLSRSCLTDDAFGTYNCAQFKPSYLHIMRTKHHLSAMVHFCLASQVLRSLNICVPDTHNIKNKVS